MDYSKFITGKEWTSNDTPINAKGIFLLQANEGYQITDKEIAVNSCFFDGIRTKVPDNFGTVSTEQMEEIKALQDEERKLLESEGEIIGNIE